MFYEFGGDQMAQSVVEAIRQETNELSLAKQHLGIWTDRGIADTSCALHSIGNSYWNLMGTMCGFDAITEMPAPVDGVYGVVGDEVRNDSAWFSRGSNYPSVIVEFERYSGQLDEGKLTGKVNSLLLAHHRWRTVPKTLILAYWTKGLAALPDHDAMRQRAKQGFVTSAKERVTGAADAAVLFFQFVLQSADETRWRLAQVIERGVQ
jgi:hypothetical protein